MEFFCLICGTTESTSYPEEGQPECPECGGQMVELPPEEGE